jgi:hypothetical protein
MSEVVKMSLSEKGINLVPLDVDINKLFSLSYTFDNLKLIMNTLLENQNIMYSKIKDLEAKISVEKEDSKTRMNILEKKIRTISLKKEYSQIKKVTYDNNNNSGIKLNEPDSNQEKEDKIEDKDQENKEEKKEENNEKEEKEEKEENKDSKEKE